MPRLPTVLVLLMLVFAATCLVGQDEGVTYHFTYDAADNLLSRTVVRDGVATEEAMPRDGSGRNRPASVGGIPLEWDANGNLTRKGTLRLAYDFRNRLTQVTDASGGVLATYVYDGFNRRIQQNIGSDVIETAWSGLRPVETFVNGTLQTRRVYGRALDEVVRVEHDSDGDGVLELRYTPLYDSSGNLVVVADEDGKPIERYAYTPHGTRTISVDLTPPRIDQVRVVGGELWLEVSELVSTGALASALQSGTLRLETGAETIPLTLDTAVSHARRHRMELTLSALPTAGTPVSLHVEPDALLDSFHNTLAAPEVVTFSWPSEDAVILDTSAPEVHEILVRDGVLEVELTEEIDLSTATPSIQVAGQVTSWTKSEQGYRLFANAPVPDGTHDLYVTEALTDLSGTTLAEQFYLQLHVFPETPTWVSYRQPDERLVAESTIANELGFHGLPEDPITGFLYARNRYHDPDLGRFITTDPLGYIDSPSLYQYAGNSPFEHSDPLGLCLGSPKYPLPCSAYADDVAAAVSTGVIAGFNAGEFRLSTDPADLGDSREVKVFQAGLVGELVSSPLRLGDGLGRYVGLWEQMMFDTSSDEELAEVWGELEFAQIEAFGDVAMVYGGVRGGRALGRGFSRSFTPLEGGGANPIDDLLVQETRYTESVPRVVPKVHMGKQGKHIPGHNNYIEGRSILRADPEALAARAGTGQPVIQVPRGQAGFKERVDFGVVIGDFVEEGVATPTTKGIFTYAADGTIHIVPARP